MPAAKSTPYLTPEQQARVANNMGLVGKIIAHYHRTLIFDGADYNDAFSEGSIGLCLAAVAFRPELGYQFSTYAWTAIMRRVARHVRGVNKKRSRLSNLPELDSWETFAERERGEPAEDLFGLGRLEPAVRQLEAEKQLAVREVYQNGRNLADVGVVLGLSHQRVRGILDEAMGELRRVA